MFDLLLVPVAIFYLLVVGALFIYGLNFLYMTYLTLKRSSKHSMRRLEAEHKDHERQLSPDEMPVVTVQLPIYNEMYVAERLIESAARLDYPHDKLEIQVLDDSTDETAGIVARAVERFRAQGVDILQIRRVQRTGFKAGALAEGFNRSRGEFLAIFDADFIPSPDFLKRTLPHFYEVSPDDPRPIAFVQTRWGHVNRDYSFITSLQALAIDAHFMVEQFARSQGGYWFNFNGTAGVWRRQAIEAAGGWKSDTLTEDLDLSYRAFLKGWRALYLRDVEVQAELPASFSAYRRQQYRWARGSFECAAHLLPQVWRSPAPLRLKIEATLHLTGYGVHLLLFFLTLLYPLVLLLSERYPALISLFGIAVVFNLTAFAPTLFFITAQQQLGKGWWRKIPVVFFVSAAGAGMMLNTVRAALQSWRGQTAVFERTPKFGISRKGQDWTHRSYQLRMDPIAYVELALAALNALTVGFAIYLGNWLIAGYAGLFLVGLAFTSGASISQAISLRFSHAQAHRNSKPWIFAMRR
jgi:cellulose synthase/poly-beta-1,6-N-acetylglucosamine synthase-like glycosyltransferase